MKRTAFYFLFIHEINSNFKSGKYMFVLIVSCIIALVFAFLQTTDFADRLNNYQHEKIKLNEKSNQMKVYSEAEKILLFKPNPLSIFSKGFDEKVGNKMIISATDIPELRNESQQKNPFLSIFTGFDTISIVTFLISLLVFLTVSNGISEEKEKGTLKLIFSNSVSKSEYFLSKYCAYLILSILPVVILFLCNILFILLNNQISLTLIEYVRILFLFLASVLFISIITIIGLIVSYCSNTVQKSVILNLSIWLIFLFIYPSLVGLIAFSDNKIDSQQTKKEIEQIKKDFLVYSMKLNDELYHNKDRDGFYTIQFEDPYLSILVKVTDVTQKYHYEFLEEYNKRALPELFTMQYKIINLQKNYRNNLYKKNKTFNNYTFFLPTTSFANVSEKLACTDLYSRYEFIIQKGIDYRELFLEYLKSRDAFGLKFFTQMPRHEMKDDMNEYVIDESSKLLYQNYGVISVDDFPEFNYQYTEFFPQELFVLIFLNIILFVGFLFVSNSKTNLL